MENDKTMAKELYDSMTEKVYSLSLDQLLKLQDLVYGAINNLEKERMIDLQNKAINALKDYYDAGGALCTDTGRFFIDDSKEYADDFYYIHLM